MNTTPQTPVSGPQFPTEPTKKKMSTGKKVALGAGALLVIGIAANSGGGASSTTTSSSTSSFAAAPTTATTSAAPAGPKTSFGPGTFLVGSQIAPGTYTAPGGSNCYYERLSGLSGKLGDIIANEWSTDHSPQIVTIDGTEKAFKSSGCGTWKLV